MLETRGYRLPRVPTSKALFDAPMTSISTPPETRSAWLGPDLADQESWIHVFTNGERRELVDLGQRLTDLAYGLDDTARLAESLRPCVELGRRMAAIRAELKDGLGFALMRGFPLDEMTQDGARLVYAALGASLGVAMPQNRHGELMHDVRDVGADPMDPSVRLSTTNAEQDFHTDGADIIGLLCVRPAKSGGLSRIVSSVSVFDAMRKARPDLAKLMFEPWHFHLKGEHAPGALPYFTLPVVRRVAGQLSTFFIGWYIRDAVLLDGVPPLSARQQEALALYEMLANQPALYLDMDFQSGDIQWLKNSVRLHKRTTYEDHEQPGRRRHLWRLWLAAQDFEDGITALRRGHAAAAQAGVAERSGDA